MGRAFAEGGFFMFIIVFTALPAASLAVLHIVLAKRWTLIVGLLLVLLPAAAGLVGRQQGLSMMKAALHAVAEDKWVDMMAEGRRVAQIPLSFGLGVSGVLLVPLGIGEVRRLTRKRSV